VEQTVHGGSDGWMRHRASGSAPEQPVPRKMSDEDDDDDDDDDGEATAAEAPVGLGRVGAGPESIAGQILGCSAGTGSMSWISERDFEFWLFGVTILDN